MYPFWEGSPSEWKEWREPIPLLSGENLSTVLQCPFYPTTYSSLMPTLNLCQLYSTAYCTLLWRIFSNHRNMGDIPSLSNIWRRSLNMYPKASAQHVFITKQDCKLIIDQILMLHHETTSLLMRTSAGLYTRVLVWRNCCFPRILKIRDNLPLTWLFS